MLCCEWVGRGGDGVGCCRGVVLKIPRTKCGRTTGPNGPRERFLVCGLREAGEIEAIFLHAAQ